jgi:hypothetical protein
MAPSPTVYGGDVVLEAAAVREAPLGVLDQLRCGMSATAEERRVGVRVKCFCEVAGMTYEAAS